MNKSVREGFCAPVENENVVKAFVFWLTASCVVLLWGPFTNYSPAGFIDPWVYTGYFTNFSSLVRQFGLLYYPSRLPYVLFGVVVYAIFSPVVANFLINLCLLAGGALALYCIVARHEGRLIAAITTLAFCFNPYVMSTICWDYPDGPAITLLLLGLWLVLAPPSRFRGRLGRVVIGSLWAMAGFTNLIAGLVIVPGLVLIAYLRHFKIRGIARDGFFVATGVVITTAFFAILSKRIFGSYLFYEPQFQMFHYVNSTPGYLENMWGTGFHWLNTAYRLDFTYGLTVVGTFVFIRHFAKLKLDRFYTATLLFLALSDIVFFFVEFKMKDVVLRVPYTSSYLVAPAFVFFGAVLGALQKLKEPISNAVVKIDLALVLAAAIVPVYLFSPFHVPAMLRWQHDWPAVTVLVLAALLAASLWGRARFIGSAIATVCLASLVSFPTTVDPGLGYVFTDQRPAFEAAMQAQNVLTSGITKGSTLRFWFDNDEQWSPLYNSINSLYLWGWRDYSHLMPTMSVDDLRALFGTHTIVVHLTDAPRKIAVRTQLMAGRNLQVEGEGEWTVNAGGIRFYIVTQNVIDSSRAK
jgi:hypothetical protein